ncbi:MarR family winged helix-turn-helix transcriptional regulator [Pseudonocardia sp. WMMC193]|uniref:MarR family winged helix-turn-helix transcriptional regulator n=1 Tax=Pseudonocardia sp. WMMC193 TaxID=2911965 RepID=UPI001F0053D1|nr:MarR family transcriptional regulator [Pseudonocardia sp. WMMC193]MCF7548863.1 MarR family transcriptional regulator [Pseudonocardia sp. WMMC193]
MSPSSVAPVETGPDSLHRLEHEITVLIRRTVEPVWSGGYGAHEAVDRYTYPVLAALDENGEQSLTVLTGRLGVSKPTASRQVSRLSRAGLVAVRPDSRDSRSVVISLTPEGAAQRELVRHARLGPLHAVLEGWPQEDRDLLGSLLARFNTDLDEYRAHGGR